MKLARKWIWLAAGTAGALALVGRGRRSILGMPIESIGALRVSPHGFFGARRSGPPKHAHQGVDLVAEPGAYVLAVGDGVIVDANPGLGKTVRKLALKMPGAWTGGAMAVDAVVYADLGRPLVHAGDVVRKGEAIALVAPNGFVHVAVKQKRAGGEVFFDPALAGLNYRTMEVS